MERIYKQPEGKRKKWRLNGILFDSQLEAEYYLHLLDLKREGKITDFRLQPTFTLQEQCERNGKLIRAITYTPDFELTYANGHMVCVDIKGNVISEDFKLKAKMFQYWWPDYELRVLTKNPDIYGGGWIDPRELEKLRKRRKEAKGGKEKGAPRNSAQKRK